MAAAKIKLELDQGSTYDVTRTWSAGSPSEPVNLTGCTANMQIRSTVLSEVPLINLTTENGGIILGGTAGTIRTIITAAQTSDLPAKAAVYDLEIIYSDGRVRRLFGGTVTVSAQVTRPEGVA